MIRSMTGFATKTATIARNELSKSHVTISIKSLNSRFFETTFKMPYALSSLEHEIAKLLKEQLLRGHVFVTIHLTNPNLFKANIEPSLETIGSYIKGLHQIQEQFKIGGSITIDTLMRLPNLFGVEEQGIDEQSKTIILSTIEEVVTDLIANQEQEGRNLLKDIEHRMSIIRSEMALITDFSKKLLETHKERINQETALLLTTDDKFAEAQKNSLFAVLDKIDTHEEVIRFSSHLQNFNKVLSSSDREKGKRLDFTIQELGREINTIASKCSDAQISAHAINVKVELEKTREQIQNLV